MPDFFLVNTLHSESRRVQRRHEGRRYKRMPGTVELHLQVLKTAVIDLGIISQHLSPSPNSHRDTGGLILIPK